MEFTIVLITLIVIPVSFYCSLLFQIINIICQIRKLPGYFFKVEGVGGGERHDFRKPIICAIKKSLPPPPPKDLSNMASVKTDL